MIEKAEVRPTAEAVSGLVNPGAALRRLDMLWGQAGPNLYERVRLTFELLENAQWVEAAHEGKLQKAEDFLEEKYFQDLQNLMTIGVLRKIYCVFHSEKVWRENRYSPAAMRALWEQDKARKDRIAREARQTAFAEPEAPPPGEAKPQDEARLAPEQAVPPSPVHGSRTNSDPETKPEPPAQSGAVPHLVERLQAENRELQREVAQLRSENGRLKARLKALEERSR